MPTWKDELYLEYHRGVFTTQANHKRNMRDSEEWLLDAEKYASLAWLDGKPYPAEELTSAWKHVLFNQFHDLAAGSGIGIIYKEAQKDYDQVHWAADEVSGDALSALAAQVDTRVQRRRSGRRLQFAGMGARRCSGSIGTDAFASQRDFAAGFKGARRAFAGRVGGPRRRTPTSCLFDVQSMPSLGYAVLHAVPGKREFSSDLKTQRTDAWRTGCCASRSIAQDGLHHFALRQGHRFESIAAGGCGNELQAFKDTPKAV